VLKVKMKVKIMYRNEQVPEQEMRFDLHERANLDIGHLSGNRDRVQARDDYLLL
jgi:hypothetical protein